MGIMLRPNCIFRFELNIVPIMVDINVPPKSNTEKGVRSAYLIGSKISYYETIMNLEPIKFQHAEVLKYPNIVLQLRYFIDII